MKAVVFVALGGCLGALSRWGLTYWIDRLRPPTLSFPLGILIANVLGCFLFGLLFGLGESRSWMSNAVRLALFTGFLGSFTTFSTFSWNTLELLKNGEIIPAFANVLLSVFLGLAGVWAGYQLVVAKA